MAKTVYLTVCFLLKKRVFSQVGSIVYLACRWCGRIPGDRAAHPETESPRQILFYLSGCKLLILPFLDHLRQIISILYVQPRQTFSLPRNVFYFFAFIFLRNTGFQFVRHFSWTILTNRRRWESKGTNPLFSLQIPIQVLLL